MMSWAVMPSLACATCSLAAGPRSTRAHPLRHRSSSTTERSRHRTVPWQRMDFDKSIKTPQRNLSWECKHGKPSAKALHNGQLIENLHCRTWLIFPSAVLERSRQLHQSKRSSTNRRQNNACNCEISLSTQRPAPLLGRVRQMFYWVVI